MQLMVEGDKWEMYIPSELGYGDSGQGGDIGGGDVLVFTMEILKIEGATRPAERGPPPFTDFTADATAFDEASKPVVMAVLRQPVASAKLFAAFKSAARALVNRGHWFQVKLDADPGACSRWLAAGGRGPRGRRGRTGHP